MAEESAKAPRSTRFIETSRGILSYAELAPLLAERVLITERQIAEGSLAARKLEEGLLLELHRGLCADLVPEWAGAYRKAEVTVGRHTPPPPHELRPLMRDYFADLNTRVENLDEEPSEQTLETLAFAEGRLLSIHPFADFNGRVVRLFLLELLRRLNLPLVDLVPEAQALINQYLRALEAADQNDWRPLMLIWQQRIEASESA